MVSRMRVGAVADPPDLKSAGAEAIEDGISICGWRIQTHHEPIIGQTDLDQYRAELGGPITVPEIVFGNSYLKLTHGPTSTSLVFTALDALRGWKEENLPPLQVNIAEQWQEARKKDIDEHGAKKLVYDWTYTTPYVGTLEAPSSLQFEDSETKIDWDLLRSNDPILFFDSFTLYESELNDTGVCRYEVKVRCMPCCWFILSRFWLRVDGNMVRLREGRIFCRFDGPGDQNVVLREVRHLEGTFEELTNAGAPPEGPAYHDSDSTAENFQGDSPFGLKFKKLEKLDLGTSD